MTEAGQATPESDLRDRIMNSNVAKSEAEWWAAREIKDLLATIARLEAERVKDGEAISFYITEHDRAVAALIKDGMPRSVGADDETIAALRARLSSRAKDQSQ